MEEFEILDFQDLQMEKQGIEQASKFLQKKIQNGFKVSIVIKKQHDFFLPPLQQKKNDLFSKKHQPVDIISQSSEQTQNNDKRGSSTSSHSSILLTKKQTIPPTQNETPEERQNKENSEKSDDEEASYYNTKSNSFEQLLKENLLTQKITTGLLFLKDGKQKLALEKFFETYKEANEKLKSPQDQNQNSVLIILCIQSLCYASQIFKDLGQINEAQRCLDKCLNQFEINDFDLQCKIYLEKASCCLLNNQYLQSLDNYTKALMQYEQVNWKLDIAKILVKMSYVYALLNDYEDAKKICYEGLSILQAKLGQQHHFVFDTYYTLGCIYYLEKEYDFALEYLDQAKEGFQKLYGEKHETIIKILNLQGAINHLQGNSLNAMETYEQIVCLYGDNETIGLAYVLNNLALAYLDRMKFKSAKLSFEKATTILKGYYSEQHSSLQRIEKNKKLIAAATLSYI